MIEIRREYDVRRLGDYVDYLARKLVAALTVDNVIVRDIVLASGTTIVKHGLSRKPQGFILVRAQTGPAGLSCTVANWAARTDELIILTSNNAITGDVMFF